MSDKPLGEADRVNAWFDRVAEDYKKASVPCDHCGTATIEPVEVTLISTGAKFNYCRHRCADRAEAHRKEVDLAKASGYLQGMQAYQDLAERCVGPSPGVLNDAVAAAKLRVSRHHKELMEILCTR